VLDFELTFAGVAEHISDPVLAAQLRLVHAFMDYASTPSGSHERRQLQAALRVANERDLDVEQLRELCVPIIGSFFEEELPIISEDVPAPS
jgi:hypothetical protein